MTRRDNETTGSGDGRYVWHLGSTQRRPPVNPRILNLGAAITDAEYYLYRADVELLEQVLTKSPFAAFQERCMDFMRATSAALEAHKSGQSTTSLTPVIRDSFDDVLSTFRRFIDRTAHLLSQRYGPDSEETRALQRAASQEFDNEFAYRFMYHLRNYSEHRGAPITRIRQASTLRSDGRVEHDFDVLFDSRKLLTYHHWHRQVRADLAGINGEFSVVVTIDALLRACGRVHCKALLAQEAAIMAAAVGIQALGGRIATDDVFGPMLLQTRPSELIARQVTSPINLTPVRTDLTEVAEGGAAAIPRGSRRVGAQADTRLLSCPVLTGLGRQKTRTRSSVTASPRRVDRAPAPDPGDLGDRRRRGTHIVGAVNCAAVSMLTLIQQRGALRRQRGARSAKRFCLAVDRHDRAASIQRDEWPAAALISPLHCEPKVGGVVPGLLAQLPLDPRTDLRRSGSTASGSALRHDDTSRTASGWPVTGSRIVVPAQHQLQRTLHQCSCRLTRIPAGASRAVPMP
jgi:hypothetical protein